MKGANIKKYLSIALVFLGVFALLIAFYFALDRYDQVSAAISKIIEIYFVSASAAHSILSIVKMTSFAPAFKLYVPRE